MARISSLALPFLLAVGCSPAAAPTDPDHPASPDAPGGPGPEPTALSEPAAPAEPSAEPAAPPEPAAPDQPADLLALEKQAFEQARPVLETHCARCHTKAGTAKPKMKKEAISHFSLDEYPPGGHHAHEVTEELREVLGVHGKKPTMPLDRPGAVKGDELAAILAWADAYDAAEQAGLHGAAHGGAKHGGAKHGGAKDGGKQDGAKKSKPAAGEHDHHKH